MPDAISGLARRTGAAGHRAVGADEEKPAPPIGGRRLHCFRPSGREALGSLDLELDPAIHRAARAGRVVDERLGLAAAVD